MDLPLNINLIIPFKDKKGRALKLWLRDLQAFEHELLDQLFVLKEEVSNRYCSGFPLSIQSRNDGTAKKYYWRFKSAKQSRKYFRLHQAEVLEILAEYPKDIMISLFEIEEQLIYINANLKLIQSMRDGIHQNQDDISHHRQAKKTFFGIDLHE